MKVVHLAGVLAVAVMASGGCGDEEPGPSRPSASTAPVAAATAEPTSAATASASNLPQPGTKATRVGLTIQVTGTCADPGGLRLASSGFTPNGTYLTNVWYPDGTPYTHLADGGKGTAATDGSTPGWAWDCGDGADGQPDPPGVYRLMMVDTQTRRWVKAAFEVRY